MPSVEADRPLQPLWTPVSSLSPSLPRPFPSEETAENDDDVYRSLEELAE